jgi:hypothetical protein|tara:strand:- start:104 stop:373 length:270 start_codon:yes stop_codon:yes gene_type:complete
MKLKFGKYKGTKFENTPKWYQNWLLSQKWFNAPKKEKPLHQQLNGWDGYSRKGELIYNAIFEQEKKEESKRDCIAGICSCCEGSMYFGI